VRVFSYPRPRLRCLWLAAVATGSGGATVRSGGSPTVGSYIVVLKAGANRAAAVAQAQSLGGDVFMQYRYALNGFAVRLPDATVPGIERNPDILFVSRDVPVTASAQSPPPGPLPQFISNALSRIGGDKSSTKSGDGKGSVNVNVAVLDSGIASDAADLRVAGGTDCVGGPQNGSFDDPQGHGTQVAGIIGALDNTINIVGVVPGANLYAVRVLNQNLVGNLSDVICGVDWVTSTRADSNPSNDVAIANMSLGGPGSDDGNCGRTNKDALHLAVCNSISAGVTYIAAAGNSTQDIKTIVPAAYNEVLTATAMSDSDGQPGGLGGLNCAGLADDTSAPFSNFATAEDQAHTLAAPGVCIPSTWLFNSVFRDSGTSFASPHIAGTVALCVASGPCAGLTPAQIIQKIVSDASSYNSIHTSYGFQGDPLRPINGRYYGYLINAGIY
jgi:subtilisin